MSEYWIFAGIVVISEIVVAFVFAAIAQIFYKRSGFDFKAIFKGFAERVFLVLMFVNGYSQALTFFSALKLATRLKHEEPAKTLDGFNDYYLLGNLLSVLVAVGYVFVWQHLAHIK